MARHVGSRQNDNLPAYKHNSSDKAPFVRACFPNSETSPISNQNKTLQSFSKTSNLEGLKIFDLEPS